MNHFILLADVGEWIGAIVTIATLVVYAINQLFDKQGQNIRKQQEEARRRRMEANQRRPPAQPREATSEIERFLQEVNRQRQALPQAPMPPVIEAEVVAEKPRTLVPPPVMATVVEEEKPRTLVSTSTPPALPPRTPQPQRRSQPPRTKQPPPPKTSQVSSGVRRLSDHVKQTVDVSDVDSKIDDNIHAKFDHSTNSISGQPDSPLTSSSPVQTSPFTGLFQDPQRFRKAFITSELLFGPPASSKY